MKESQEKRNPGKWLLLIPIQLMLSVAICILGVYADSHWVKSIEASGHPAPAFTVLAVVLGIGLFVLMTIISIIMMIVTAIKN